MKVNLIHHESCLDTLKKLDDDSIDLTLTSPPYNMNLRIRYGKYTSRQIIKEEFSTKYDNFDDNLPLDEYNKFHSNVLEELIRVSKLVFYNTQLVTGSKRSMFKMIGDYGEYLKDRVVWDKGYGQPAMQSGVMNSRFEDIYIFEKEYPISRMFKRSYFDRGTLDNVWSIPRPRNNDGTNLATFPEELVEKILENFSVDNDVVYDPFMGTGTTALVASRMGRRYIGSEISKEYIKIANDRIKNDHKQLELA